MTQPEVWQGTAPVLVGRLDLQPLRDSRVEIYDRPVGVRLLFRDPRSGAEHYLVRYPAGLGSERHRHSAAHTFVVIEGTLEANGERFGPGSYCHFPAGTVMHHGPAGADGCLFVAIFDGPQDVQVAGPMDQEAGEACEAAETGKTRGAGGSSRPPTSALKTDEQQLGSGVERWSVSAAYRDMWVDPGEDPRDTGVELRDERSTLQDYLRAYRLTLEMKCEGLDPEQLATRSVPPSTMSLLGIVRHMARVESHWFRQVLAGETVTKLFWSEAEPDLDWDGAVADQAVVEEAWKIWRGEVAFGERFAAAHDLDYLGRQRDGELIQLREVLLHMVEEYARHCGHADLLRERVDGRVGQ